MLHVLLLASIFGADDPVTFQQVTGQVHIQIDNRPFATYTYEDPRISRPYFCDIFAPNGVKVTRNNPPVEGQDLTDHDTYHPGLWLAFGDISGADFWRNKAKVRHMDFVEAPKATANGGTFTVKNSYETEDKQICIEECRFTVVPVENGAFLLWDSVFYTPTGEIEFGDQEEMGLGVRIATPLTVEKGNGAILNSEGGQNEDGTWGKQADWCDYSGTIDGKAAGITLMPHPQALNYCLAKGRCFVGTANEEVKRVAAVPGDLGQAWFHARDYGLLVANHFGRNAFTEGPKSRILVPNEGEMRLSYGIFVHNGAPEKPADLSSAYDLYRELSDNALPEVGERLPHGPFIYDKLIPRALKEQLEPVEPGGRQALPELVPEEGAGQR